MMKEEVELRDRLLSWLANCAKLVIMGIGNPLRGDDRAAAYIVRLMRGKIPQKVALLNCVSSPENYLGRVESLRPSHILMIDAAELGLEPGSAKLVTPDRVAGLTISTHAIPLSTLAKYLGERTSARQMLLGIQPKTVEFGRGLSKEMKAACRDLARLLLEILEQSCGVH